MAKQKHFAEINGETTQFERVGHLPIDCGGKNSGKGAFQCGAA